MGIPRLLRRMRADWDGRARLNARHFVATLQENWTDEEFFRSGVGVVRDHILTDMENICQGKDPKTMRVLEIGCGAARVTRALAGLFGEVHAVDISAEMVAQARHALIGMSNAFVYQNNGADLSVVPTQPFDFVFSTIVFQHIPSRKIIYSYMREVHRLLRPGALSSSGFGRSPLVAVVSPLRREHLASADTSVGVSFPMQAEDGRGVGFDPRYRYGEDRKDFWLWFFRQP
jgi:SAM-dependent methyltransferase